MREPPRLEMDVYLFLFYYAIYWNTIFPFWSDGVYWIRLTLSIHIISWLFPINHIYSFQTLLLHMLIWNVRGWYGWGNVQEKITKRRSTNKNPQTGKEYSTTWITRKKRKIPKYTLPKFPYQNPLAEIHPWEKDSTYERHKNGANHNWCLARERRKLSQQRRKLSQQRRTQALRTPPPLESTQIPEGNIFCVYYQCFVFVRS